MYFIYGGDRMESAKTKEQKIESNHRPDMFDIEQ